MKPSFKGGASLLLIHADTPICAHLLLADVQDTFQRQLLKVKAIALIEVGADRLGVVVDHHRLLAHLSQRSDAGDSAPVKFHAAA